MNIAPINSVSIKHSPQNQSNKSRANVAFGVRLDESWPEAFKELFKYNKFRLVDRILGKKYKDTPMGQLSAALRAIRKQDDGLVAHIRPAMCNNGDYSYSAPAAAIVSFYREGENFELMQRYNGMVTPKNPQDCVEYLVNNKVMTSMATTIKELADFFRNPAKLVKDTKAKLEAKSLGID